jgi:hypothetical protein
MNMWKLIITQRTVTDYGYDRKDQVEFVTDDVGKLTRIIDYFSTMTNKETEYAIVRGEEE